MKRVWIFNHYASTPTTGNWVRHYNFARYMLRDGWDVKIFASSARHNGSINLISDNRRFVETDGEGVPYVYVRTRDYTGNGLKRIFNLVDYYFGLKHTARRIKDKPDLIYASSVQPLACLAGLQIARKYKIPCVCEIRDLWPESLIDYLGMSPHNPAIVALRILEKHIYKKCDRLIFTMSGGGDYIRSRGWDKCIDMSKISYINNGVDLDAFDRNRDSVPVSDAQLSDKSCFNVVYTGSIRHVNNIGKIAAAARVLSARGDKRVRLLLWGAGDQIEQLQEQTKDLDNFVLKGYVDKTAIPSIVSHGDACLEHWEQTPIMKYGNSANKIFDYLASGRPILSTIHAGYDIISGENCGVVTASQSPEDIADALAALASASPQELAKMGENARAAAQKYDFKVLTKRLTDIFEELL